MPALRFINITNMFNISMLLLISIALISVDAYASPFAGLPAELPGNGITAPISDITEYAYIFNTLLFIACALIALLAVLSIAFMRISELSKPSARRLLYAILLCFSTSITGYFLLGYALQYNIPSFSAIFWPSNDHLAAASGDFSAGYAFSSDWLFQATICTTPSLFVTAALIDRAHLWQLFTFAFSLSALIFPISAGWVWGNNWLHQHGFLDFAGSSLVFSFTGWALLAATLILRHERPLIRTTNGNPLYAPVGIFLFFLLWFAVLAGAQLSAGTAIDAISIGNITANGILAAVGAVLAVAITTLARDDGLDERTLFMALPAGLAAISAEPLLTAPIGALLIGIVAGVLFITTQIALVKCSFADPMQIFSALLLPGLWGTLIVPASNPDATLLMQAGGALALGILTFSLSGLFWLAARIVPHLRYTPE